MITEATASKISVLKKIVLDSVCFEEWHRYTEFELIKKNILDLIRYKLEPECRGLGNLVIVVTGGTNCGKSSIINWLVGREISKVSVLARGTKSPMAAVPSGLTDRLRKSDITDPIQIKPAIESGDALKPADGLIILYQKTVEFPPGNTILIDSPDFDSDFQKNREWAEILFALADAVLFVVTPEKYNDAAVVDSIKLLAQKKKTMAAVFNKFEVEESYQDFRNQIWKDISGNTDCFLLPRYPVSGHPFPEQLNPIKSIIMGWSQSSRTIKTNAIQGTLQEIRHQITRMSDILKEQSQFAVQFSKLVQETVDRAVFEYIEDLKSQKFYELDMIFQEILKKYRIPIIDDIYEPIRQFSRSAFRWIGEKFSGHVTTSEIESKERSVRELHRYQRCLSSITTDLIRLQSNFAPPYRRLVDQWLSQLPANSYQNNFASYEELVERAVIQWIRDKSNQLDEQARGKPYHRNFLIGLKGLLQTGAGIAGVLLTGGLHGSDLILGPVLERSAAYAIEKTVGKAYCRKLRKELWDIRTGLITKHIELHLTKSVLDGCMAMPIGSAQSVTDAANQLPQALEILECEM